MNRDIAAKIARARESLEAAMLLGTHDYADFAASRAYYSMFYVAEALLASIGLFYSSHSAVLAAYGREFSKTGLLDVKFHRFLIDAQDFRNVGDYGIGGDITCQQAEQVCMWAREFIQHAESYLAKEK